MHKAQGQASSVQSPNVPDSIEPPPALVEMAPLGKSHLPLSGLVASKLREAILSGTYKVGTRLVEDRLAHEFAVSRNPVREALRALATEGLVEITPRCGATVTRMSKEMASEMIEVRAALEGLNARLAARRHKPETITQLQRVLQKGKNLSSGNIDDIRKLNAEYHDFLAAAGGNSILGELVASLRDRTAVMFSSYSTEDLKMTWDEHSAIIEAVIAGDEDLAALFASRHVLRSGEHFMSDLVHE